NVVVLREVLERIPLLRKHQVFIQTPQSGKVCIDDRNMALLLASMAKELATKHRDVGVRPLLRLEAASLRVECVACRMDADKSLATANFCEQRLFSMKG